MVTIATHNGSFHLDDLLAVALVMMILAEDEEVEVIRTRDAAVITKADWVVDVGGIYNHELRRYDHHQKDRPVRENGVPYAAFGLLWRHWGAEICQDAETAALVETEFIQMIDGPDNGFQTATSLIEGGLVPSLAWIPVLWRPTWLEDELTADEQFFDLLPFVFQLLDRIVKNYQARSQGRKLIQDTYEQAADKRILELPSGLNLADVGHYSDVLFVLEEDKTNQTWKAKCLQQPDSLACRQPFPEAWRGLTGKELQSESGYSDAEFVHPSGFLAVARSRETLLDMCREAAQ